MSILRPKKYILQSLNLNARTTVFTPRSEPVYTRTYKPIMAQMSGLLTSLAEARPEEHNIAAANPRPDYEDLGGEVGATTAEILGYLHQYAASTLLDLPMTLTLGRLQTKLRDQLQRLNTNGVVSSDRNDCDGVNLRVATCCEEAIQALIDLEIMIEKKGTRLPTKLVAGEDPITDLTGTDFTLQDTEALTGSLARLDELLSTNGQLPPAGGDVEDQPGGLAYLHDETFDLILSVVPSYTCFADTDDHPTEDRTTLLEMKTTFNSSPELNQEPGLGSTL